MLLFRIPSNVFFPIPVGIFAILTGVLQNLYITLRVRVMTLIPLSTMFQWRSVLLVEETGGPGENHRPVASHRQTLSHNVVSSTPRLSGVRIHNFSGDRH